MTPSAEPTSPSSVSGVCSVTDDATYPSHYSTGDSVRAPEDNGMEHPGPSSAASRALDENIVVSGPAVDEPQSQSSNSSEPASAVADQVVNAPSHRKRGARKPTRRHSLIIRTPLAQLAGQFPRIQIPDLNDFVNRPFEKRFRELDTAKNPSEGKRPMNAFLLYRKAYQSLAKTIYGQKNHQFVSQICGDSWKIESRAVRDLFNDLAITERINQHMACRAYTERVISDVADSEHTPPAMDVDAPTVDVDGGDPGLDVGELDTSSPLHQTMVPGSAFPSPDESESPPLEVVDEGLLFVISDDHPLFSAPVDSPLFAAFAESDQAGANSGMGVNTWQTGLGMPITNINQVPPFPNPQSPLDTALYQHPFSIEVETSFSPSEEDVDSAPGPSEQGSSAVGDSVPASPESTNAEEDWVYYPPASGTFSMAPGLGGI